MKKLNITKEQFNRSNYFQRKYGKLEYVSESGRLFKTNKGKVLKFVNESFYGIEGAKDVDWAIIYKNCHIEPSEFYGNLGEMYDQEHPEDPNHEGFDDWCWENTDLIESELEHLASYDDNYEGDPYYKESRKKIVKEDADDQEKEFSYKGVVITRYDYESLPMPMAASKLDDKTMQKIAEDIYNMLLDHGWEDKDIDRYLGRNLDELEDETDRDANMIKEDFWEYMENAAVANGMEYYSEMEDGDEYMESRKFNEAVEPPSPDKIIEKWIRASIKDGTLPGVEKFKVSWENQIKYKGSFMYWAYVLQQIGLDSGRKDLFADESEEYYPTAKYISKVEGWLAKMPEEKRASLVLDALDKVYEKGGVFTTANTDHTWLGIPGTEDGEEYVLYKGHEVPKDDIYEYLAEDYPEFSELENDEDDEKWLLAHKKEVTEMLKEMAWAYDESTKKFGKKFFKEYVDDSAGLYGLPSDHYSDATRERMEKFAMQQRLKKGVIVRRTNKVYDLWRIETVEGGLRLENNINGFDKAMNIAKKNGWNVVQTIPASAGKVNESFGMGFGDRFCDCESDPIEYNGQTYDTWTMYSGDDEIGDVMFADDALRQDMEENGVDPQIMEMVDLWVNPRDSVEDAIDQIIGG